MHVLDQILETANSIVLRGEVQQFLRERDVREAVEDVARPLVSMLDLQFVLLAGLEHDPRELVQRYGLARRDVDGLAGGPRRDPGEHVGPDDVLHVGEVAGLRAIAEDGRVLALQDLGEEDGDDASVGENPSGAGRRSRYDATGDHVNFNGKPRDGSQRGIADFKHQHDEPVHLSPVDQLI